VTGLAELSDEALAARARGGDERAFEALAGRYERVIGAVLRGGPAFRFGMTREDTWQEALIGLWNACRKHRPEQGRFGPFAATCIRNKVRNARVRAERPAFRVVSDALGLDCPIGDGGPPLAERLHAGVPGDPAVIIELREELARVARERPTPKRSYSNEDVSKALELVREGMTFSAAGAAVGAHGSTVTRWVREVA
jgi:DNA-directed RNA polymerase specialized sigma24 family protein